MTHEALDSPSRIPLAPGQWCWIQEGSAWARLTFYYLPMLMVLGYNTAVYWLTRRTVLALQFAAQGSSANEVSGSAGLSRQARKEGLGLSSSLPVSPRPPNLSPHPPPPPPAPRLPPPLSPQSALPGITNRMRLLLAVFLVCLVPSIVNRLYDFISPDQPSFLFSYLQCLSAPLQVAFLLQPFDVLSFVPSSREPRLLSLRMRLLHPSQHQGLGNAIVYGWGSPRVRRLYTERCPRLFARASSKATLPAEVAAKSVLQGFATPPGTATIYSCRHRNQRGFLAFSRHIILRYPPLPSSLITDD